MKFSSSVKLFPIAGWWNESSFKESFPFSFQFRDEGNHQT
ncbi:hypothetical protein BSM4216_2684 [Bacillus smithii]|nr:hypothetical protein BSM4216_2684 [Bacillus smithii]